MSEDPAEIGIAMFTIYSALLIAAAAHPPLRRVWLAKMGQWFREIRYVGYEMPLRLTAGRRRPDYRRIAELERDLFGGQP